MSDRFRNVIIPTVFMIGSLLVLVFLGNWQVERLSWKRELIANAVERPQLPPVAAPGPETWSDFDFDHYDYRAVRLSGRYGDGEVHVYTVLSKPNGDFAGQGFWIVSPFVTADGWTVIVNRGFVPGDKKDLSSRPESGVGTGDVDLVGLVRRVPLANSFTPDNNLETNEWYLRDPGQIGRHLGVPANKLAPYSIDLVANMIPPGGLPQAGETRIAFTNSHLQYAITWYGLALTLLGVYSAFMWGQWRARKKTAGTE